MKEAGSKSAPSRLGWRGKLRLMLNRVVRNPLLEARIDRMERSLNVVRTLAENVSEQSAGRDFDQLNDRLQLYSSRLGSLQVRLDVMSGSVAALRAEVADLTSARAIVRPEPAIADVGHGLREDLDGKIANLMSVMNDSQRAGLELQQQKANALIEMINRLQLQMLEVRQAVPAPDTSHVFQQDLDGKIANLMSVMNDSQRAGLELQQRQADALIEMINRLQLQMVEDRAKAVQDIEFLRARIESTAVLAAIDHRSR